MHPQPILKKLSDLAESITQPLGLFVVDVRFGQKAAAKSIKVTIFKENLPVTLSDCEAVSRKLEELLDKHIDEGNLVIEGPYVLEVESPGIERVLTTEKEFCLFKGKCVRIQMKSSVEAPYGLGASFTGILAGQENGCLKIVQPKPFAERILPHKTKDTRNKRQEDNAKAKTLFAATKMEVLIDRTQIREIRLNPY